MGCGMQGCSPAGAQQAQRSLHAAAPELQLLHSVSREVPSPSGGQAAKFQPRAHFYSMTAVRPGTGCRREGHGCAMRGWFTQHCLPHRFPLPVWGRHARYYKTSFFLSLRVRRGPLTPPGPPHPVHPLPSFVLLFQAEVF